VTSTMVEFTRELLAGQEVVVDSWQTQHRVGALRKMMALYPDLLECDTDESQGREIWTLRRRVANAAISPDGEHGMVVDSERSL